MAKQVGFIGLGKMGKGMVKRLLNHGYQVVAYDYLPEAVEAVKAQGAIGVSSLKDLAKHLQPQRITWLMVPPGEQVDKIINKLVDVGLDSDDIIIDGGNSNYHDSIRRNNLLKERGIFYLDIGVSGGPGGAEAGFSLMIGGPKSAYETIQPILGALTAPEGCAYIGLAGSGHFVKMVHNAIEYGMME